MSHWNYRVCKETYSKGTQDEEPGFTIREAYYNSNGEIWAVTEDGARSYGESLEELEKAYKQMAEAFAAPVVDIDTIVYAKVDSEGIDKYGIDWSEAGEDGFEEKYAKELAQLEAEDEKLD